MVHVWPLGLSHNHHMFIRGWFAVPVLRPSVSVIPKAIQTLSRAACLPSGRSLGSESSGQSPKPACGAEPFAADVVWTW